MIPFLTGLPQIHAVAVGGRRSVCGGGDSHARSFAACDVGMKIEVSGPALIPSQIGAQTIVPMCPLGEITGREVAIEIDYVRASIAAVDSSGDSEKRGKSRERK